MNSDVKNTMAILVISRVNSGRLPEPPLAIFLNNSVDGVKLTRLFILSLIFWQVVASDCNRQTLRLAIRQEQLLRVKGIMEIGRVTWQGQTAMITPMRELWLVKINSEPDLEVRGNRLDHEGRQASLSGASDR
jgi:hypothetical protein